ncbi:lysophospholipid acyltransferase family protein [Candidatus Omnitrophota bacterium]
MLKALKAVVLFLDIILCILVLVVVRILFFCSAERRARIASRVCQASNTILARIIGLKIRLTGHTEFLKQEGLFFVSNHLSYIDGLAISSLWPLIFIGRSDIKEWPLFGLLCTLSDTIFVNRINPSNIKQELKRIIAVLGGGANVILFPEGTSTDGRELLPFKTSFFEAPLKAGCRIVPLAMRYLSVNGQPLSEANKDFVYWYGEMYFFPHLIGVLGLREIELEVKIFEPLQTEGINGESYSTQRKYVGTVCQEIINNHLNHHEAKT